MAEKEKKIFIPQLKKPENGDKWYTRKIDGGISLALWAGRPAAWVGSTLANCVGYSWGRFAFLENNPNCMVGCALGTDYPADAWAWYKNSKAQGYETGLTPKLGAVAVWSRAGAKGHVANVEKVYDNNEWDSSESGYNTSPVWFTRHYNYKSYRSGYTFLGFIYPKYDFIEEPEPKPEPKFKIGDEVIINGPLYRTANSSQPSGSVKNKKTKIALYAEGSMHPYNTTGYLGWMNTEDIEPVNPTPQPEPEVLKKGDYVKIVANGNSRPDGTGNTCGGIGWKRYILSIKAGMKYPYQVGVNGITTGYYKAEALKKI